MYQPQQAVDSQLSAQKFHTRTSLLKPHYFFNGDLKKYIFFTFSRCFYPNQLKNEKHHKQLFIQAPTILLGDGLGRHYLIQFNDVRMVQHFHDLYFTIDLLQVHSIQLGLIDDLYSHLLNEEHRDTLSLTRSQMPRATEYSLVLLLSAVQVDPVFTSPSMDQRKNTREQR